MTGVAHGFLPLRMIFTLQYVFFCFPSSCIHYMRRVWMGKAKYLSARSALLESSVRGNESALFVRGVRNPVIGSYFPAVAPGSTYILPEE